MGLTGGIGSGKSEISKIFSKNIKISVIDADLLARKAVETGSEGEKQIFKFFGDSVIDEGGRLDRKVLGSIVFNDRSKLEILNTIVHPIVEKLFYEKVKHLTEKGEKFVLYDCPLLIEENLFHQVNKVLLVRAPIEDRIYRIIQRNNISREEALKRIKAQLDDETKEKHADYIFWNDGTLDELKASVIHLWEKVSKIYL
ncbi:dephospho-CoA kinase [Alkalibacter sp. M17DMB]|nr:dephospho-CoA kinase [Alkalibacter mobilis]